MPSPQKGGGKFSAHVDCDQTAGWMMLVLGMVVGLSPGEFVLDGDRAPSPKRGRAPPQFEGMRLRISKLGRKWGALPVIANFVALEQQLFFVKTRSESV